MSIMTRAMARIRLAHTKKGTRIEVATDDMVASVLDTGFAATCVEFVELLASLHDTPNPDYSLPNPRALAWAAREARYSAESARQPLPPHMKYTDE